MIPSSIREYVGIACQTLMGDEPSDLEVMVPEFLPMVEGSVDQEAKTQNKTMKVLNTAKGGKSIASVKVSDTITCEYLGCRTGMSMPNVYLGEQVKVINLEGNSTFYWVPMGRDDHIRKTEHLKIRVADKPKQQDPLDDDHSYFFEMDTREGKRKIHIHTSAGTEEEVTYDLLIDTDKSEVSLIDSKGNGFILKSKEFYWKMYNSEEEHGSFWEMDKDNIHLHAVDTFKVTSKNYVRETEETDKITTPDYERNSTTKEVVNTPLRDVNVDTAEVHNVPVMGVNGALGVSSSVSFGASVGGAASSASAPGSNECKDDMTFKSNVNVKQGVNVTGSVDVKGGIAAFGDVKATPVGIKLALHKHIGNMGAPTTPPVPGL